MKTATLVLTLMLLATTAYAQQSNFTDRNGRYQGSTFQNGNSTTFTDRDGKFSGTAIQNGNSTTYYDRNGRFQGQRFDNTPPRK